MSKSPFIIPTVLSFFFFYLAAQISFAAKVPILKNPSKQEVEAFKNNSLITLGKKGDISIIKSQPGRLAYRPIALPDPGKEISSRSAIIIDAESGNTLYAESADAPRQPASTIKVITGLIAIKSLNNNELVRVSYRAAQMPRSKIYLNSQKSYKANDLINAVLLSSANDASVALAEKIAGSEKEFTEMMNIRAKLWGAKNTVCKTATGLTVRGQHSTARDLAMIFRHAMRYDEFINRMKRKIVRTSYGKVLTNHNKALKIVKGAVAGKTGYTRAAQQTYVGQFTRNNESIIVAIMGSKTMWKDIQKLVDYGFKRKYLQQLSKNKLKKGEERIAQIH